MYGTKDFLSQKRFEVINFNFTFSTCTVCKSGHNPCVKNLVWVHYRYIGTEKWREMWTNRYMNSNQRQHRPRSNVPCIAMLTPTSIPSVTYPFTVVSSPAIWSIVLGTTNFTPLNVNGVLIYPVKSSSQKAVYY